MRKAGSVQTGDLFQGESVEDWIVLGRKVAILTREGWTAVDYNAMVIEDSQEEASG